MISLQNPSVKQFPSDLLEEIKSRLLKAKQIMPKPWIAAFDADGTLWDFDIGHEVFEHQIKNHLLTTPPPDPWSHYIELKKQHPPTAYLWLAQVLQQQSLQEVRDHTNAFIKSIHVPVFESMKSLVNWLQKEEFEIYVVSASVKWSVEPGAKAYFNIPYERVLGVQTEIQNGLITNKQLGEITWKEGKPKQLLLETNGVRPLFTSGNTIGDLALLESATHVQLAVMSQAPGGDIYATEKELHDIAVKRNYLTHLFL